MVVIAALLAIFHGSAARFALVTVARAAGYGVSAQQMRLGGGHGALVGVRVTRNGQPVLEAQRIDVYYSLRDLLPGSNHRYGLVGIAIDRPHITLIHNPDGTYNIAIPAAPNAQRGPRGPVVPINMTIRIRDGSATLIDRSRFYSESRVQSARHVNVDATINTSTLTTYSVTGSLMDSGPQPFRVAGEVDETRSFALHHVTAKALPIRTIGNYFINSPAARILGGTVRNLDARMYAFDIGPDQAPQYHLIGAGHLVDGQMFVRGLASPIRKIDGRVNIFDGGFGVQHATAMAGHIAVAFAGGIFDFRKPQFRLGVDGSGDLSNLKEVAAFAKNMPITGGVHIRALIEGDVAEPILFIGFSGKRFNYENVPIDDPRGDVALYRSDLIVLPFHATYDGIAMHLEGNLALGPTVKSTLALHAIGPSTRIPYLGALVPDQPIGTEVLLTGNDLKVNARGFIASRTDPENVNGFYAINAQGVGAFGPLSIRTPGGGTLVAGFDLDRPHGNSGFWLSAKDVQLRQPHPIAFPGLNIPQLPPIDAHIDEANIAGTGSSHNTVIGGTAYLNHAVISGVPFDTIAARFAGPFAQSAINQVYADGPWGSFQGRGSFSPSALIARGNYSGSLQDLRMFIGSFPAQGQLNGPVAIAIAQGKIYVQAQNAQLRDGSFHGIPVRSITGTMAYDNGVLHVYSAQAGAAGGTVVAAGTYATAPNAPQRTRMALATTTLDASMLHRGFGVPINSGSLRAIGAIAPGGAIPNLDAGVVLQNGTAAGYGPFSTSAEVAIHADALHLHDTIAGLAGTYARVGGAIGDLAAGTPRYDLTADVPAGRIGTVAAIANVPTYHADGSFEADVSVGGYGLNPTVRGSVGVPVGSINGLGFRNASAQLNASRSTAKVRDARVQIGSTTAHFAASVARGALGVRVQLPHTDLSDFNDYFDTGDTLAGTGSASVDFAHAGKQIVTGGTVAIRGLRYRALPIGDTNAHWSTARGVMHAALRVGGEHGELRAGGTIAIAPGKDVRAIMRGSRYNVHATLAQMDLGTWLPALGYPQVPVTGRIDGAATVIGRVPYLAVSANASVKGGTIGPLPIDRAEFALRSAGDRIDLTRMAVSLPALEATGSGSFGLTATAPVRLDVHAVTDDLPRLVAHISKKQLPVTGRFESTLTIDGTLHALQYTAGVEATNMTAYGVQVPSFVGQIALRGKNVVIRNAELTLAKGRATIAGSLPLQLQPFAIGPPGAPIAMDFSAQGVDLSAFAALLGNGTKLGGTIDGHLGVTGSVDDPQLVGRLAATGVNYVSALETVPITQTVAELTFNGRRATLDRLSARLGPGTLSGTGTLDFGTGPGGPLGYALAFTAKGARLSTPQFGSGTFDSTLRLEHAPAGPARLSGNVTVSDAVIPFLAFLKFGGSQGGTTGAPPFNLAFNLGITAGKNVAVRGGGAGLFGLDIPARGSATLLGTLVKPELEGEFNATGGTLTYIDHAFKVQTGSVTFTRSGGVIPTIYAVATTHVTNPDPNPVRNPTGTADITLTVSGPVTSPKVTYASDPPGYTQQQIVALLLPLGGLVGPIQFTDTGVILPSGQINGAPAAATGALLPDMLVARQNGTLTIGEEAFNILNAQFARGILAPVESALGNSLGLSDVNLTLDYTGNVGINFRRLLAKNFYAVYGTTFGVPVRQTFGFAYQPNQATSAQFTMFVQQGPLPLFLSPTQTISTNPRATVGQAVQGQNGFTFLYQRLF